MANLAVSPIKLCPLHFGDLALFNRKIGNLDEVLLYSKICFHQQHSKINHAGKQCIARSRQAMANWFGWSLRKVDALLASLEKKGVISKAVGLWKGIKAFFISAVKHIAYLPINLTKLNALVGHTGSVVSAIIFSRISFGMNNTKIEHEGLKWCAIKKEALANLAGIGIRTLDKILSSLQDKGYILKKNFVHSGKRQMHYHIPECVIGTIVDSMRKEGCKESKKAQKQAYSNDKNTKNAVAVGRNKAFSSPHQNCRVEPAKSSSSIKEDQIKQKTNNITKHDNQSGVNEKPKLERLALGDIQFLQNQFKSDVNVHSSKEGRADQAEKGFFQLSKRQQGYIRGVIDRLIRRDNVIVSNPKELEQQLCYAIANDMQYKHLSFKHAVNRLAQVILSGNWTTPYGFYKHSVYGRKVAQRRVENKSHTDAGKCKVSVPTFPDRFKDLLKLDLSCMGQGYDASRDLSQYPCKHAGSAPVNCSPHVNAGVYQCDVACNATVLKISGDGSYRDSERAGTTKMSQGGTLSMSQHKPTGLSQVKTAPSTETLTLSTAKVRPQSRADALNASIARCQARLAMVTGEARDALVGVIQRLLDELRFLSYACVVS